MPMKLATLRDGSRDGQLAVVCGDLSRAHFASGIAGTLQQALDDWAFVAPQLLDLAATLEQGKARHAFPFEPRQAMAPLPRAAAWLLAGWPPPAAAPGTGAAASADAAAPARGVAAAPVAQAGDHFGAAADPLHLPPGTDAACWLPTLAVVTGDLPRGCAARPALDGVRLLLLGATAVGSSPADRGDGPAPVLGTHFAPLALTPDELGPLWRDGRAALRLELLAGTGGGPDAPGQAAASAIDAGGTDFGALLALWLQRRPLGAGAVLGWCASPQPAAPALLPWRLRACGPRHRPAAGTTDAAAPAAAPQPAPEPVAPASAELFGTLPLRADAG